MRLYPFIEAEKSQGSNVKRACELLKVSRAACYAARDGRPSSREQGDTELAARIEAVHEDPEGRYGAPRVHAQLKAEGQQALTQAGCLAHAAVRPAGPGREAVEEDHRP